MDGYPVLTVRCPNEHEWNVLIPKYWTGVQQCEICGKRADSFKWGGMTTLAEIQKGLKK